jgi:hypothetical protein
MKSSAIEAIERKLIRSLTDQAPDSVSDTELETVLRFLIPGCHASVISAVSD